MIIKISLNKFSVNVLILELFFISYLWGINIKKLDEKLEKTILRLKARNKNMLNKKLML